MTVRENPSFALHRAWEYRSDAWIHSHSNSHRKVLRYAPRWESLSWYLVGHETSVKESANPPLVVILFQIIRAANMLLFDKDIGHAPLARFLFKVVLKLSAVFPLIELEYDGFDFGVFCCKKSFGLFAIWTPALGEHNNGISSYGVIDNFFGGGH